MPAKPNFIVSKKENVEEKNKPRTYNRYEQYQLHKSRKEAVGANLGEMADKKELTDASAAVSGSAIISSPTAIAIASSASPSSFAAAAATVPATSRYISDRKRSSDQIGSSYEYDDSASGVSASASASASTSTLPCYSQR